MSHKKAQECKSNKNGYNLYNGKGKPLLVRFPNTSPLILGEHFDDIGLFEESQNSDASVMRNAPEDKYYESDTITFHAIAIY